MKLLAALVLALVTVVLLVPLGGATVLQPARTTSSLLSSADPTCPGSSGPCPMGIADFGVTSGGATYTYTAIAFKSTVTFTKLDIGKSTISTKYPEMSIQQNVVADRMYFKGTPGFYWTQDVPFVVQEGSDKFVVFALDNIWNFQTGAKMTGVTGNLEGGCSSSGVGTGGQYFCESKSAFTVSLPFTVTIEMLVGEAGGHSAVEFEYGVSGHSMVAYDLVEFPGKAAAFPFYAVDYASAPLAKILLLDAETVLCGPGGGSSVTILSVAATFTEDYQADASASFTSIPHAWSEGRDTAETSSGVHMSHSGKKGVASSGTDNSVELW